MGKRSDIPRIPQDKYDTPADAVQPLLRHLAPNTYFCEPAAGNCKLADALEAAGHACIGAFDINPPRGNPRVLRGDMLKLNATRVALDAMWITNPPWKRVLLHDLIQHAMKMGVPTWLLIDAPWMHTQQAALFMALYCKKVVTIGRVCWFPETKKTGKDDCCWYLFTPEPGQTIFYGHKGGML